MKEHESNTNIKNVSKNMFEFNTLPLIPLNTLEFLTVFKLFVLLFMRTACGIKPSDGL